MDCTICAIHKNKIPDILEITNYWILRHSEIEKNCPGYLYLEPKAHIENLSELSVECANEIGSLFKKSGDWVEKNFSPKKIYTVSISEKVPHLHFHIVPRYTDSNIGLDYIQLALTSKIPKTQFSDLQFQNLSSIISNYLL
ncbi:MAG: HIT domain-containing protein [Leptospiraceae bacterium]|nr:HIT domain-containing protein [Leptospiraceae bacterium]